MYSSNLFKLLSISLCMSSLFSSAMEPENHAEKILLSIANQSEKVINALIIKLHKDKDNVILKDAFMLEPYADGDNLIFKNEQVCVITQQGFFLLLPSPTSWELSWRDVRCQRFFVEEMPYHQSNNIMMIINPDDFVSLARANTDYAREKMNKIEQENDDNALINQESVSSSSEESSSEDSSSYLKRHSSYGCKCGESRCGCRRSSSGRGRQD